MDPNLASIQEQMENTIALYQTICIFLAAAIILGLVLWCWREFSRWGVNKIKVTIWPDSRVDVEDHGTGKSRVEIIKHPSK